MGSHSRLEDVLLPGMDTSDDRTNRQPKTSRIAGVAGLTFVAALVVYLAATAVSDRGFPESATGWLGYAGIGLGIAVIATVVIGGLVSVRGTIHRK